MTLEPDATENSSEQISALSSYLIKGDLSGIQGFIFNVQSDTAARSLKGRSFFLKILLEVAMRMIFIEFGIEDKEKIEDAKISTSGGNFILRIDKYDSKKFEAIQSVLTKSLQYTGLNIALSCVKEAVTFTESKKLLDKSISERKHQLLSDDYNSFFQPFHKSNISAITSNNGWSIITDQLRLNRYCSIAPIEKEKFYPEFKIDQSEKTIYFAGFKIIFINEKTDDSIVLEKHLESLIPLERVEGHWATKTFNSYCREGHGINKLGVLAMDVDNLGFTIDDISDISEHQIFDERLRKFFNDYLKALINQKFRDKVYTVTAGGDDSYFVGKWNTMLDLSIEIQEAFTNTFYDKIDGIEEGKKLSISAALVIVDPKFPVMRFAQMVEDALKEAKYEHPESRGNISLFGEIIKWEFLKDKNNNGDQIDGKILKLRKLLKQSGENASITSGLLAKARLTSLKVARDNGLRLSDYWQLSYFMRNFKSGGKILEEYRQYLTASLLQENELMKKNYRLIFPIAARLAEFDKPK